MAIPAPTRPAARKQPQNRPPGPRAARRRSPPSRRLPANFLPNEPWWHPQTSRVDHGAMASTADLLASYVHAAGVRHIFGYPGESVIDFLEAARHSGIEPVSAVREGTAAFMAQAAAMATGRLGVCLSTLGPGSTALLNGVACAIFDRVPMLAVSGQVEGSREQFFTHQVVDHGRMFAPAAKLALRLESASATRSSARRYAPPSPSVRERST